MIIILLNFCLANEIDDYFDNLKQYKNEIIFNQFIAYKNLGLVMCIKEFYQDANLPLEILESEFAYELSIMSNNQILNLPLQDNKPKILNFIKLNINNYLPFFKNFSFKQPWYFVACLNMKIAKNIKI